LSSRRVQQRLDRLADGIVGIALRESDPPLDLAAQPQTRKERVQQGHAAEGRQAVAVAGNPQISRPSEHRRQTALLVGFHEAQAKSQNTTVLAGKTRK